MNFTIYYRGQEIEVVEAKTEKAALKAHYRRFSVGTKGTTVAVPETKTVAEHQQAMKDSLVVPG